MRDTAAVIHRISNQSLPCLFADGLVLVVLVLDEMLVHRREIKAKLLVPEHVVANLVIDSERVSYTTRPSEPMQPSKERQADVLPASLAKLGMDVELFATKPTEVWIEPQPGVLAAGEQAHTLRWDFKRFVFQCCGKVACLSENLLVPGPRNLWQVSTVAVRNGLASVSLQQSITNMLAVINGREEHTTAATTPGRAPCAPHMPTPAIVEMRPVRACVGQQWTGQQVITLRIGVVIIQQPLERAGLQQNVAVHHQHGISGCVPEDLFLGQRWAAVALEGNILRSPQTGSHPVFYQITDRTCARCRRRIVNYHQFNAVENFRVVQTNCLSSEIHSIKVGVMGHSNRKVRSHL